MNGFDTPRAPDHLPDAPRPLPLSQAERAEIQRQGAKAAARGEPAGANPLHRQRNTPATTGEAAEVWRQRSTAWEQGHASQTAVRRKVKAVALEGPG